MTKTETRGWLLVSEAREVRSEVTGEAIVVEVVPGRFLFALPSGSIDEKRDATHWVFLAYQLGEASSFGGEMMKLPSQTLDAPVPPESSPMLVTFDDISKPETVRELNPTDLVAVFGAGVPLQAVRLEVTEEAVTERRLDALLPWLGPYPEPGLCPATGGVIEDPPLCRLAKMGDFIRRL